MKICVLAISIIALSAISTCEEINFHHTFKDDQEPVMNWLKRSPEDTDVGISLFSERRGLAMDDDGLFKKRRISSNSDLHLQRAQRDQPVDWFQEKRRKSRDPPVSWFTEKRQIRPIEWFSIRRDPTASSSDEDDLASLSLFKRESHANSKSSKSRYHPQYKIKASLFKGILSSKRNDELNSAMLKKDSRSNGKFHSRKSHDNSEMLKLKV